MEKTKKVDLIQRQLGLRHKLKVHDSMKLPDTHEDIAHSLVTKWDFEDEINAIEEVLSEQRRAAVAARKAQILKELASGDAPKKKPSKR